jgi:hypothetical protein
MAEIELEQLEAARPRSMHLEWVFPTFFRPGPTLKKIVEQERAVWIAPLLILSILAIVLVLSSGGPRTMQAQSNVEVPQDFQYWPPEMQQEFWDNQANKASTQYIYIFPMLGALAGVWIPWFLLGSILHLVLTMNGSRGTNTAALNLVGYASLPFALRYIVQAVAILSTKQLITSPGVSGFIAADAGGFMTFLRAVLAQVDIYLIWLVVLLMVGVLPLTGLTRGKAWMAVLVSVLIIIALKALPAFIGGQLNGLSTTPYF